MPDDVHTGSSTQTTSKGMAKPAIRLRGVRKEYRLYSSLTDQALDVLGMSWTRFWRPVRYRSFAALDGIDLEIVRGERVGIVGRNGAGKTTMLKLVTGNFAPTAGEVEVHGEVQALMQTGLGFHGEFTGLDNIRAALVYNGLTGGDLAAAVEDVIEFCELGDFLDQPVKTYSLGMRARLQFAAATAIKPDIVIIDEVLGAGDAYFAGKSSERIKRLTAEGVTLLIVSHSMQQILQFSNRAIWMDQGHIIASGDPLDIVNRYEEFIYKLDEDRERGSTEPYPNSMRAIPSWVTEKDMGKGSDWGGNGPLRVDRISIVIDRKVASTVRSRQPFKIVADVVSNVAGNYPCSCVFTIYSESGEVILRAMEPERNYSMSDRSRQRVIARIDPNPIGAGKYVVSAALFRDYCVSTPSTGYRYHILSRGFEFRVINRERDNSRILTDIVWTAL